MHVRRPCRSRVVWLERILLRYALLRLLHLLRLLLLGLLLPGLLLHLLHVGKQLRWRSGDGDERGLKSRAWKKEKI